MNDPATYCKDESSSFTWMVNLQDGNVWSGKSPKLSLKENGNAGDEFYFKVHCTYNSSNCIYYAKCFLKFLEVEHNYRSTTFDVQAYFGHSHMGHCFRLQRDQADPTLFKAINFHMYEPSFSGYASCSISVKISTRCGDRSQALIDSMKCLLLTGDHSDLTLRVEDESFAVHKNVLSSRSRVLARMIDSDMLEKKLGEIRLRDTRAYPVCEQMLGYLYSGECDVSSAPHELLKLAHFLELHELQSWCGAYLLDHVTEENVVDTLILADNYDQYDLLQLKNRAAKYVEDHESTLVKRQDFRDYLDSTICCDNLAFVLKLADKYKAEAGETLDRAIEFIRKNYKEALQNEECRQFLASRGDLMLRIYVYSCDKNAADIESP